MAFYNFTLTVSGINLDTEGHEDALFEAGCDDAMLSYYGKAIYLEFERDAPSLKNAIATAIQDIEGAGIGARVESVDSTLVGLSDIAELSDLSRQAITMLKDGTRGKGDFPNPIQRITGQSPLWDWAEVAQWLENCGRIATDSGLVENARELNNWNLALRIRASKEQAKITECLFILEQLKEQLRLQA
ncbi:DNA-binding protein [Erwiniaceae bacterium BAC15a-03b]|uniref:DNA-binding protein n=1 Tax=Winslowiella arboricola TaxID=2978220 RepID=A0A9J6PNF5_9GAMM|nr:DNA-binding protein [Winslowiella arboricola]MCU5774659.1 DNA-binding protein [Winslowiella arboricola]MCU5777931.1 DNA-binding protein [Winslowiella arboricola]